LNNRNSQETNIRKEPDSNDIKFVAEGSVNTSSRKARPSLKSNSKIRTIIIGLIIFIILCVIIIPFETVSRTEQVPYEATEEYTVQEPYSEMETYYEETPYLDEECTYRSAKYNTEHSMEWVSNKINVVCTMTNYETEALQFTYELYTKDKEGTRDSYGPRTVTIGSGQTIKKEALLQSLGYYGCSGYPEQIEECKSVTKFKNTAKQRSVTKYRDVVKTRKVTKFRTDTIYTNVNWVFRVPMPWLGSWREEGYVDWYISLNEQ
jgi:hypothetical protein